MQSMCFVPLWRSRMCWGHQQKNVPTTLEQTMHSNSLLSVREHLRPNVVLRDQAHSLQVPRDDFKRLIAPLGHLGRGWFQARDIDLCAYESQAPCDMHSPRPVPPESQLFAETRFDVLPMIVRVSDLLHYVAPSVRPPDHAEGPRKQATCRVHLVSTTSKGDATDPIHERKRDIRHLAN
jgi:hypothetical protein